MTALRTILRDGFLSHAAVGVVQVCESVHIRMSTCVCAHQVGRENHSTIKNLTDDLRFMIKKREEDYLNLLAQNKANEDAWQRNSGMLSQQLQVLLLLSSLSSLSFLPVLLVKTAGSDKQVAPTSLAK